MTRGVVNDLTGQVFGHLTVLAREASDNQGNAIWSCLCECGSKVLVRGGFLRKRQRYCSSRCQLLVKKYRRDLSGQRFGRLTALALARVSHSGKSVWQFRCDCGEMVERSASDVIQGDVRSCGCLGKESRIRHGLSATREYHRKAHREWAKRNPGKVIENVNKRRKEVANCAPAWLTAEHRAQIEVFYSEARRLTKETGVVHHVDHIVPLRGKTVQGLHVPWNLQVLTAIENMQKHRKLLDDVC